MKKPNGLELLTVIENDIPLGPYPPLGFVAVWEGEFGNGDYYGLYWPLGREQREPIICEMLHDEWGLQPSFSSVLKFRAWLDANDGGAGDVEVADEDFAPAKFAAAKALIARGEMEGAITLLREACDSLPEVGEYWFALAGQLRRVGRVGESHSAAVMAYRANWAFGSPAAGVLRALRSAAAGGHLSDDPVVRRSGALTLDYGGAKENGNYALLLECAKDYLEAGQPLAALQLHQNYAYMMCTETTAFQERYGFELEQWRKDFSGLCLEHLGDSRRYAG